MNVGKASFIERRRSVRAFNNRSVSQREVEMLLEEARWSPSGGNMQPWRVIAVTGDARDAVSSVALQSLEAGRASEEGDYPVYPSTLPQPLQGRRMTLGAAFYGHLGVDREDKAARQEWAEANYRFFDAPVGLFFIADRGMGHAQWAHLGMFMQSVSLATVACGLGGCFQEAWGHVRQSLHDHFELPDEQMIYCGMALGWPDKGAAVNAFRPGREEVRTFCDYFGFPP